MLKGNPQLFDLFPIEPELARPAEDPWLAHVWDYYPFPNGTMNTARGGPPSVLNAAVGFRPHLIIDTLDQLIGTGLSTGEAWLLDIPRRVDELSVVGAEVLFSDHGEAAIRYPKAAITNLYLCNELLLEIRRGDRTRLASGLRPKTVSDIENLFGAILGANNRQDSSATTAEVVVALREIRSQDRETDDYGRFQIWSSTMVQQAFMLLHELGHIADHGSRRTEKIESGLHRFSTPSLEEELDADAWAADRLERICSRWFEEGMQCAAQPLQDLFAVLELLFGDATRPFLARYQSLASRIQVDSTRTETAHELSAVDIIRHTSPYRRVARVIPIWNSYPTRSQAKNDAAIEESERRGCVRALEELKGALDEIESQSELQGATGRDRALALIRIGNDVGQAYWSTRGAEPRQGSGADPNLERQIAAWELALRSIDPESPLAGFICKTLGFNLVELYFLSKERHHLDLAVSRLRTAAAIARTDSEAREGFLLESLNHLGIALWSRYDEFTGLEFGNLSKMTQADLLAAMDAFDEAIDVASPSKENVRRSLIQYMKTLAIRDRPEGFRRLYNLCSRHPELMLPEEWLSSLE